LVKRGLRVGVAKDLRPIERVFLCLVLTHSEALEDQYLCMEEWERAMEELAPNDPLNVFHEVFRRHVAVIQRFGRFPHRNGLLGRESTPAEEAFLADSQFRFDLPLVRQPDGTLSFAGTIRGYQTGQPILADGSLLAGAGESEGGAIGLGQGDTEAAFGRARSQLRRQGFVRIGDQVPDFTAETSQGSISLHDSIGDGWCVLFSYPADFTSVAETEIAAAARLDSEWRRRDTTVLALSVDGVQAHRRWIQDIAKSQGVRVDFPIIADEDRRLAMQLGILDRTTARSGAGTGETVAVGSVFIISPSKRVELVLTYPVQVGRNFDEILRVLDALQLGATQAVATPANWHVGQETLAQSQVLGNRADPLPADQAGVPAGAAYSRF
jgi:peroxiredoxin